MERYKKIILHVGFIFLLLLLVELALRVIPFLESRTGVQVAQKEKSLDDLGISIKYLSDACQISADLLEANKMRNMPKARWTNNGNRTNVFIDAQGGLGSSWIYNADGFNSEGFRDREYSIEKPNNTYRIIVLGSCIDECGMNRLNDLYSKRLEWLLNNRSKTRRYEVMVMAQSGTFFDTKICLLQNHALKYNPDLILFKNMKEDIIDLFFINEMVMADYYANKSTDKVFLDTMKTQKCIRGSAITVQIVDYALDLIKSDKLRGDDLSDSLWNNKELTQDYLDKLKGMKALCDANHLRCIGFLSPDDLLPYKTEMPPRGPIDDRIYANLSRYLEESGIEHYDLRDYFSEPTKNYRFVNDNGHYSPHAHATLAYALYNELLSGKVLPNWEELEPVDMSTATLIDGEEYICPGIGSKPVIELNSTKER